LFAIGTKVLEEFNHKNQHKSYVIFANDIMHIKYGPGGYFKSHEDYLSLNSNFVNEYSMIVCVSDPNEVCIGGETNLLFNKFFKYASSMTKMPGGCLLFRKDIPHEGSVIISGHKEIITFNVWSIENDVKDIDIVSFENDNRKYILDTEKILSYPSDNILKAFVSMGKENPNQDFIIFGNSKKYKEFLTNVKTHKLPCVPFKIVFAERSLSFDGNMDDDIRPFSMMPIWLSFFRK